MSPTITPPDDYVGPDRRAKEPESWHLDKRVPLTLLMMMAAQVVAVIMFFADIKRDVELLKADVQVLHTHDKAQSEESKESTALLRGQLDKLEVKIDRLIESSGGRK